jgi:release factor glutamine methyltransferase
MVREESKSLNSKNRIDELLGAATLRLENVSDTPRLDAELLLARAIDVARSYLFAHPDDELDQAAAKRFRQAIEKRADGMPLAYITGEKEFWSMSLVVSPDTLIPRPDTEVLVEQVLSRIPRKAARRVLDLGTGSGAVALAIARERPLCDVVATDASAAALRIAAINAQRLGIPNVEFLAGDWFAPLGRRRFDIIASNPPYVEAGDGHLDDLRYEPADALIAGADGLDAIRIIAAQAAAFLVPGGCLLIEHGERQADAVEELLLASGWRDVRNTRDLAGRPRVTIATR